MNLAEFFFGCVAYLWSEGSSGVLVRNWGLRVDAPEFET